MHLVGDKDFVFDLAPLTVCLPHTEGRNQRACFSLPWTVALRSGGRAAVSQPRLMFPDHYIYPYMLTVRNTVTYFVLFWSGRLKSGRHRYVLMRVLSS